MQASLQGKRYLSVVALSTSLASNIRGVPRGGLAIAALQRAPPSDDDGDDDDVPPEPDQRVPPGNDPGGVPRGGR